MSQFIVHVSPEDYALLTTDAKRTGVSRRKFLEDVILEYLQAPRLLVPVYVESDRMRIRFWVMEKTHKRVAEYAMRKHVTMSAVLYSALRQYLTSEPKE